MINIEFKYNVLQFSDSGLKYNFATEKRISKNKKIS